MEIMVGDKIGIDGATGNHGCTDYAIVEIDHVANKCYSGKVIEAQSCHSCWQVGHDADHVFAEIGEPWSFNDNEIEPAGDDWAASIKWQKA